MAKLSQSVEQKMEGNQLESRDENKMWLVSSTQHHAILQLVQFVTC